MNKKTWFCLLLKAGRHARTTTPTVEGCSTSTSYDSLQGAPAAQQMFVVPQFKLLVESAQFQWHQPQALPENVNENDSNSAKKDFPPNLSLARAKKRATKRATKLICNLNYQTCLFKDKTFYSGLSLFTIPF